MQHCSLQSSVKITAYFPCLTCYHEDAAEDAAELKQVEEMDAVNEESKAALAEGLAGKIAKEKAKEAAFQEQAEEEIQAAIDKDNAEEAEELKQIEKADPVNEESKAALADALADKMAVQKQVNMVLFMLFVVVF